jgi:hypothetical protein
MPAIGRLGRGNWGSNSLFRTKIVLRAGPPLHHRRDHLTATILTPIQTAALSINASNSIHHPAAVSSRTGRPQLDLICLNFDAVSQLGILMLCC